MRFCLLLLLFLVSTTVLAIEEPVRIYRSARSLGMGGVLTTSALYGEALFGNPARISEASPHQAPWKIAFVDTFGEVNDVLIADREVVSELNSAEGPDVFSKAANIMGRHEHYRVQNLTGIYHPQFVGDLGFAFGIFASSHANFRVDYTTDVDTQLIGDFGPVFGFSYPLLNKTLLLGTSIRVLYRVGTDQKLSATSFLSSQQNISIQSFGSQGIGIDGDIGFYYKIPLRKLRWVRFALAGTLRNIAKTHYTDIPVYVLNVSGDHPPHSDRLLDLGFRFDFPDAGIFYDKFFSIEFQNIGNNSKRMSLGKRIHLGGEWRLKSILTFRLGLHQGYPSAGFGLDFPLLKFDFATYAEELTGISGGYQDRRYSVRIALEI